MLRTMGGMVSFLAAVLGIAVVVLWVRSRQNVDLLLMRTTGHHVAGAASIRGGLLLATSDLRYDGYVSGNGSEQAVAIVSASPAEFAPVQDVLIDKQTTVKFSLLGFQTAAGQAAITTTLTTRFSAIIVPDWFIVTVTALILITHVWRKIWIPWQRRRKGLCLHCGYDIRASTARCPECGKAIAVATATV